VSIEVKRGDVILVDLDSVEGSEKGLTRPCVVIQNDTGNKYSPLTIVAIITSQQEIDKEYPTDVWVNKGDGGLYNDSIVQCDQIRTIDKKRIIEKYGRFNTEIMEDIDESIKISLSLTWIKKRRRKRSNDSNPNHIEDFNELLRKACSNKTVK